jgi:hypothetical protein
VQKAVSALERLEADDEDMAALARLLRRALPDEAG